MLHESICSCWWRLFRHVPMGPVQQAVGLPRHAYDLPMSCLSKGEQFRVELALGLCSGSVVDEFTSNTDR